MDGSTAKRPWLAAVLSVFVTGLGHVYLRRWFRAIAWIGLAVAAAWLFVPDGSVQDAAFAELVPISVVILMSVLDAYLVAKQHNRSIEVSNANRCPECQREVEDDLEFCWNCAAELERES